jgi:hypothetical protein
MTNRPDIIIKNTKEKTCILIDMATPANTKCNAKRSRKKELKYDNKKKAAAAVAAMMMTRRK